MLDAVSPTRAAASSRARREEQQPQPSTSGQPHAPDRPFAAAKAEPISQEARKALGDAAVAFCKHYTLFNQDQFKYSTPGPKSNHQCTHRALKACTSLCSLGIVFPQHSSGWCGCGERYKGCQKNIVVYTAVRMRL